MLFIATFLSLKFSIIEGDLQLLKNAQGIDNPRAMKGCLLDWFNIDADRQRVFELTNLPPNRFDYPDGAVHINLSDPNTEVHIYNYLPNPDGTDLRIHKHKMSFSNPTSTSLRGSANWRRRSNL